jgi:glucokinase
MSKHPTSEKYVIGIDLGGTRIKGILINDQGEIIEQLYQPTNDKTGDWKVAIKLAVEVLKNKSPEPIKAVGLSAPGLPNDSNSAIAYYPDRLQGLENFEWASYLGEKTVVLNDAHAAIMAELSFGVAKGKKNVVLLTLGTGVGGGIVVNGELYQGLHQKAGHIGHITVDAGNFSQSILGMPGSIEEAIGNYSVEKRSLGQFQTTFDLVQAYKAHDTWATYVWLTSLQRLSVVLASLTNVFSPELIVLGGGISEADNDLFDPLSTFMNFYEFKGKNPPTPIVKAHFGDMAGAMGAASFAISKAKKQN